MLKRSAATLAGGVQPPGQNLPGDGPSVCLLYESEEERLELSRRLRKAGLGEVPWQCIDLGSRRTTGTYLDPVRRLPRSLADVLGTGTVATLAVLTAYWPLIAAVTVSVAPVVVLVRLVRGWNPSKVAAAA
jgi:hypothetical protein